MAYQTLSIQEWGAYAEVLDAIINTNPANS